MQFLPATFDAHAVDADERRHRQPPRHRRRRRHRRRLHLRGRRRPGRRPAEIARIYNPGDADGYADQPRRRTPAHPRRRPRPAAPAPSPPRVPGRRRRRVHRHLGRRPLGGRSHQGVDIFAAEGTPVVAPADGTVEHYDNQLGGLSYRLYADDGTYYYGTHLSAYENVGAGHVTAGTAIGYVGRTGNAATTPPHLHWEIHPDGRGTPAINPTPTAEALCASNRD